MSTKQIRESLMAKKTLYDEDGNPIEVDIVEDDGEGPAALRKALKKEKEAREASDKELAQLRSEVRGGRVADVLKAKGVSEKIAKFIPSDITAPEQIEGWLKENEDVFGFKIESETAPDDSKNQEQAGRQAQLSRATETGITPTKQAETIQKLNDPNLTKAELDAMSQGGQLSGLASRRY